MKLVFLPGMDGTGNLFTPLLRSLSKFECQVIALPEAGAQDYLSLTEAVKAQLPTENFILVAESFSGPIGAALASAGIENMKGIIFVATFLSPPNHLLLAISQLLPLKLISSLPFAMHFHKVLFLGPDANYDLAQSFLDTVRSLPAKLIKARLHSIQTLGPYSEVNDLPVGYIQAKFDKLVSPDKAVEFKKYFNNITIKTIGGPHFILQANPEESAIIISELAFILIDRSPTLVDRACG